VRVLLEAGSDVGIQDRKGNTALSWAAIDSDSAAVQLLMEHGAVLASDFDFASYSALREYAVLRVRYVIGVLCRELATIQEGTETERVRLKMDLEWSSDSVDLLEVPYQ
jgi:ankyrin repeat protein